ncbi:preprotein translocase subunit SecA [Catenulispora sp. GP43]|uniref:preprotein translocase subunit SecA n=1 Tax=Catenulispora sp. GP43 TaxID=3156263 RepID=UPI003512CD75
MSKFRRFGGGKAQSTLERCRGWAHVVDLAEEETRRLSDAALRQAINTLKQRHQNGESLDALLPETFAIVREASVRTLGERPYAEQLIGGAALHLGAAVEMKTGEGKTLTGVLTTSLHALTGRGVHVLTANDYLAARDAEWMGPVYGLLGFRSVLLARGGGQVERQGLYAADVVYGTAGEFAYDYLRDHLVREQSQVVQRDRFSAVVDEADLVMLDEAGTLPQTFKKADLGIDYAGPAALAARLEPGVHYVVDKTRWTVAPTERGMAVIEDWYGGPVYNGGDVGLAHRVSLALRAKELYVKDRDYAVVDGAVQTIDTTTQRLLPDRTHGGGLDQALDAKEGLKVRPEQQCLAAIDVHAYLGLYSRLAGMTGVIEGEADAYQDLYGMECVIVPPHHPVRRVDHDPTIFANDGAMLRAVRKTVQTQRTAGRPVLVGTASDEMAARISQTLLAAGIEHAILDARSHEREAEIIARAGRPGAITVLTRMAGRGVDIRLAEPEGAGLYVLGVGPLDSRRMELHLRGRAGRGGDPGESAFYFSLDDTLLKTTKTVQRLTGTGKDEPIGPNFALTRSLVARLNAVSAHRTQTLTQHLRFSAVREEQRAAVYARREEVLRDGIPPDRMDGIIQSVIQTLVLAARTGPQDVDRLVQALGRLCPATISRDAIAAGLAGSPTSKARADLVEAVVRDVRAADTTREAELGPDTAAGLRRRVMLSVLDRLWRGRLRDLEDAYDGLALRTVAGGDALGEYQRTASRLAATMWEEIEEQFVGYWFTVKV